MKKMREIAEKYGLTLIYLFGTQAENGRRHLKGEAVTPERFSDMDIERFNREIVAFVKAYEEKRR